MAVIVHYDRRTQALVASNLLNNVSEETRNCSCASVAFVNCECVIYSTKKDWTVL